MSSVQCVDQKSSGSDSSSTGEEERLKQLFLSCDSNNDGCLNCEDLYDMCRKLNMAECAEEIINTLGANTKGSITFDEFLSCREKVFQMQTEADTVYFTKSNSTQHQNFKQCGTNWPAYTHDRSLGRNQKCVDERSSNPFHKLHENTNLGSSASETSLGNSGAEYDSGAQDLCGEPQSLHLLLQRDFADLYNIVFPFLNNTNVSNNPYKRESHTIPDDSILLPKPNAIENGEDNINNNNNTTKSYTNKELINTINFHSKEKLNNHVKPIKMELSNVQLTSESNPYLTHVRNLFECANTLHIQRTAQLRSEIRDLSHRLQGLQTSRDMSYREIQRLQKEKEQLRNELTNQISRYEDRLTELHSVIAELQRRLKQSESNIIHEVEEFDENEIDDDEEQEEEGGDPVNRSESDKRSGNKRFDNHAKLSSSVNNNSINQYNESNMSEISDTSVDAIMDDDEVAADGGVGPGDDEAGDPHSSNELNKYGKEIGRKYQNSNGLAKNFLMQTTRVYDQLNRNYSLSNKPLTYLSMNKDVHRNNIYNNNNNMYISNNNNNNNNNEVPKTSDHDLLVNYETVLSNMQKTQLNCLEQDNNYNNNNNMIDDNQLGDVVCTKSSQTTNATHGSSPMNSTTKIPGMLNDDASLLSSTGSKLHSSSRPIMGLNRSVQMKSIGHNNNNVLYPITSMNQVPATASIQQNNHLLNQMTLNETINKDYNTTNLLPKTNSSDQINPDTGVGGSTTVTTQSTSTAATTTTTGVTEIINTSGQINQSNVYDLPEPEWITQTLKQYYEYNILHSKQNISSGFTIGSCSSATTTTTSGGGAAGGGVPLDFEQSLFDHISTEEMILLESNDHETEDEMTKHYLPSQFSPNALLILLSSLANSSPYPRLSEAFQCAQLIWRRLLTKLARYRADCLVLQANLAEIKSNADHMQCQLNQIEANWSVIVRAVQISESALEISDCLNQLYSTELAVTICRQTQKHLLPKHPFSTISSSTSSSSFHGYSKSSPSNNKVQQQQQTQSHQHQQQQQQSLKKFPSQCQPPSMMLHQPYAVISLTNSTGSEEHDLSNHGQQILQNNFNLNTLKLFRQQAEFLAYTVLDKYETSDGGYEKILPTTCMPNMMMMNAPTMVTTPSVVGATVGGGGGLSHPRGTIANHHQSQQQQQQHPSQSPVSPGVFSIQSAITSSNSLLDNNSVYANSWYVSLNRSRGNNGDQFRQQQQQQQQQTHVNGSFPSMNHPLQQHPIRMNTMNNNPQMRTFLKSYSPHINTNQTMSSTGGNTGNGGGGWETPDSGAGSSSMNEVSSQQQQQLLLGQQSHHHQQPFLNPPFLLSSSTSSLLFGHFYQTYGVNNNINNNNNNSNGSNSNNKLNSQSDLFLFNSLLDNLPPLWTFLAKSSASFYESDLDSSDSSDALGGNTTHTTHQQQHNSNISSQPSQQQQQQHNQTPNTSINPNMNTTSNNTNSYIHLSNWSRIEERKLRTIYCQLINTYKRLKSMLIDLPNFDMSMNHEGVLETSSSFISSYPDGGDLNNPTNKLLSPTTIQQPQQQTDSDRMSRLNQWNSASMNSLRKLPLAVFLENSVLLQELCCVKEECADLKVRVYLLEKELCANRLTLESRAAAERALRAHLDALITEQHNRYSQMLLTNDKQKENSTTAATTTTVVGINQHEIVLLRGQVKNLLQALEALRSSTEIQQVQSEELIDDLKRANSALITAFEKAKRKYTTRIKKLEDHLSSNNNNSSNGFINSPQHVVVASLPMATTIARTTLHTVTTNIAPAATAVATSSSNIIISSTAMGGFDVNNTSKAYTPIDCHNQFTNIHDPSNMMIVNSNSEAYPMYHHPMKGSFTQVPTSDSVDSGRDLSSNQSTTRILPVQLDQQLYQMKSNTQVSRGNNQPMQRSQQCLISSPPPPPPHHHPQH